MQLACVWSLMLLVVTSTGTSVREGACNNTQDLSLFETHKSDFHNLLELCARKCWGRSECSASCLQSKTNLSLACTQCFGNDVGCTSTHCAIVCISDPQSSACIHCSEQYCLSDLLSCTGVDNSTLPHARAAVRLTSLHRTLAFAPVSQVAKPLVTESPHPT